MNDVHLKGTKSIFEDINKHDILILRTHSE